MRSDIPLREVTTQEVWNEVQKFRSELTTHNHLTFGSQGLTGTVRGILQSPNFVSGTSGWQLLPDGSIEANSGTFRGSLEAATITGGTFQTSSSGQRVVLTGADDALRFYDASNNVLMQFGVTVNPVVQITSYSDVVNLQLTNNGEITDKLASFIIDGAGSTADGLLIKQVGLGYCAELETSVNTSRTLPVLRLRCIGGEVAAIQMDPIISAPSTPVEGQFYTDTDHFPYYYDNTAWRQMVLSGPTQTINGVKTFGSFPVTPSLAPSTDYQVANKKYVDDEKGMASAENGVIEVTPTDASTTDITVGFVPKIIVFEVSDIDCNVTSSGSATGTADASNVYLVKDRADTFAAVNTGSCILLYHTGSQAIGQAAQVTTFGSTITLTWEVAAGDSGALRIHWYAIA